MNVLHGIHKTPWPTVPVASLRLWDSDDTRWSSIEVRPGHFDFAALDQWLELAQHHHAHVLYTFGRVPGWANGYKHQSVPPIDLGHWDEFVRRVVNHAQDRIDAYELWNEPNMKNFWSGDMSTLVAMAEHGYRIIKTEQPRALVTTPSPTWGKTSSPSQWLEQYFAAGGGKYADVIAFHGYIGSSPESLVSELERIREVAKKYGLENKPIWDTEFSWGTDTTLSNPRGQASFLARSYILHVSQGVHRLYWYAWDGSDGKAVSSDSTWGTLWDQNGERPPAKAMRTVIRWLSGTNLPVICTTSHNVWECRLKKSDLIVWDPTGKHPYAAQISFRKYRDLDDNAHTIVPGAQIPIGPSPVLLQAQ